MPDSPSDSPLLPILSDQPADEDQLGFAPYAKTLADILADPNTDTPLTIGVFGGWGQGKTSLMRMVQRRLQATEGTDFPVQSVWFNAWLYHHQPSLWRALISRVLNGVLGFPALDHTHQAGLAPTPIAKDADGQRGMGAGIGQDVGQGLGIGRKAQLVLVGRLVGEDGQQAGLGRGIGHGRSPPGVGGERKRSCCQAPLGWSLTVHRGWFIIPPSGGRAKRAAPSPLAGITPLALAPIRRHLTKPRPGRALERGL